MCTAHHSADSTALSEEGRPVALASLAPGPAASGAAACPFAKAVCAAGDTTGTTAAADTPSAAGAVAAAAATAAGGATVAAAGGAAGAMCCCCGAAGFRSSAAGSFTAGPFLPKNMQPAEAATLAPVVEHGRSAGKRCVMQGVSCMRQHG